MSAWEHVTKITMSSSATFMDIGSCDFIFSCNEKMNQVIVQMLNQMACTDLSESILKWTDRLRGRASWEADLFALFKRPGGNSVEVPVANSTSKAG